METKRLEVKVGLFVFLGLVLLAVLLIQFSKGTSLFRGTYELHMNAGNVSGLKVRAGVQLSGVNVGNVSDINLAPDGKSVTITLKIYNNYTIYSDARFVIEQAGFLGDQFVAVVPTKNEGHKLANNEVVPCEQPFDLQEVARAASGFIKRIDETARKLNTSITDLQRIVLNGQTMTNFAVSMENIRSFSDEALGAVSQINGLIATNGSQVGAAVSNVVAVSTRLNGIADSAENLIQTNSTSINTAVKNIEASTETLKALLAGVQSGKGLAGTLVQNQELATNVQAIAYNLSVTTSNLNRLGLWGLMFHHEPVSKNKPLQK